MMIRAAALSCPAAASKFDVDRQSTVFIFMGAQLLYTLLTLLPTKLMYDHHVSGVTAFRLDHPAHHRVLLASRSSKLDCEPRVDWLASIYSSPSAVAIPFSAHPAALHCIGCSPAPPPTSCPLRPASAPCPSLLQLVHGVMLALFAVAATHNGSCFYVEVFSRRYQADIERAFAAVQAEKEQKEQREQREQEQQVAAAASSSAAGASEAVAAQAANEASGSAAAANASTSGKQALSPAGRSAAASRNHAASSAADATAADLASSGGGGGGGLLQSLEQAAGSLLAGGSASGAISGSGVSYGLDFGALAGGVLVPDGDDDDDDAAASVVSGSDAASAAAAPVDGARGGASTVPVVSPASDIRRRRGRAASSGAK